METKSWKLNFPSNIDPDVQNVSFGQAKLVLHYLY